MAAAGRALSAVCRCSIAVPTAPKLQRGLCHAVVITDICCMLPTGSRTPRSARAEGMVAGNSRQPSPVWYNVCPTLWHADDNAAQRSFISVPRKGKNVFARLVMAMVRFLFTASSRASQGRQQVRD